MRYYVWVTTLAISLQISLEFTDEPSTHHIKLIDKRPIIYVKTYKRKHETEPVRRPQPPPEPPILPQEPIVRTQELVPPPRIPAPVLQTQEYLHETTTTPTVVKYIPRTVQPVAYSFLSTNHHTLVVPHVTGHNNNTTDVRGISRTDVGEIRVKKKIGLLGVGKNYVPYPIKTVLPGNNLEHNDVVQFNEAGASLPHLSTTESSPKQQQSGDEEERDYEDYGDKEPPVRQSGSPEIVHHEYKTHKQEEPNYPSTTELVQVRERRIRPTQVVYREYRTPEEEEEEEPNYPSITGREARRIRPTPEYGEPRGGPPEEPQEEEDDSIDDGSYQASYQAPVQYHNSKSNYDKVKSNGRDEDLRIAASGGHSGQSKSSGGHDSHSESGGGSAHGSSHHGKKGEKGSKGHKGHKKFEKGKKGKKDKESHEGQYGEEKGHEDKHSEGGGHYGEHHKEEEGHKDSKIGKGGKHKKGKSTKGQHNIVKKNEFTKSTTFYDEDHEGGEHEKHAGHQGKYSEKKGGHKKGEYKKSQHDEGHKGKKGHFDKGHHDEENYGHEAEAGDEEFFDEVEKYGSKKGEDGGKKWDYKKGKE